MRRAKLGTLAFWLAGGATAFAGSPPPGALEGMDAKDLPAPFTATPARFPAPTDLPISVGRTGTGVRPAATESLTALSRDPSPAPTARPPLSQAPATPNLSQPPAAVLPSVGTAQTPVIGPVATGPEALVAAPRDGYDPPSFATEDFGSLVYGSVDYLLFKVRRGPAPPLVQIIPPELANFEDAGNQLPPNAAITVFGGDTDPGTFNGVRGQLGIWLNGCQTFGLESSYTQLFEQSESFFVRSNGVPVIGRGFANVAAGREAFLRYVTPNGSERGFIDVDAPTRLYTLDGNLRIQGPSVLSDRLDFLSGLRYLNLREALTINSGVDFLDPAGGPPTELRSNESFRTRNQFYGSQTGVATHYRWRRLTLDVTGKLAMGWVHQEVEISGGSVLTVPGQAPQVFPNQSILFVQPTNAGRYTRDRFAVLPELLIKGGLQITPNLSLTVGYNLLAVSSVVRPGATIDPGVNPSNTRFIAAPQPNPQARPAFGGFHGTDFWAQGLTLGVAFAY